MDRDLTLTPILMSMDDTDDSILDYPPTPRPDVLSESSMADPDPVEVSVMCVVRVFTPRLSLTEHSVEVDTVTTYIKYSLKRRQTEKTKYVIQVDIHTP